jgi:hypothetical protein
MRNDVCAWRHTHNIKLPHIRAQNSVNTLTLLEFSCLIERCSISYMMKSGAYMRSQIWRSQTWLIAIVAVGVSTLAAPINTRAAIDLGESQASVTSAELGEQIGARITKIPEFAFIRKAAESLGVRAYLFGGSAAAYAHYVNWDLKREHGDTKFQPDRFDYDTSSIYRSTQDLDIVVDGPSEKARDLQARLVEAYPHLRGGKSAWEVRLLRQDVGDKQALLSNPEYLNQHTDSNSTGMIEITKPPTNEPVIRDLREWDAYAHAKEPAFLKDVRNGAIHYYSSPLHETTAFYKGGRNPPIFSVIRYLTKAFQYGLKVSDEDLTKIKAVIDRFDPQSDEMKNDYVRHWLLQEGNGKKLIKNASDIEIAWNTLEKLGLRKKLIAIENNPQLTDSLAWWMDKEPLRSFPIGQGQGKTASELEITTAVHTTGNFSAYESIMGSHTRAPNVFSSRADSAVERAIHGSGFYMMAGDKAMAGPLLAKGQQGLNIHLKVRPDAREGSDFELVNGEYGKYIIGKNRAAFEVISRKYEVDPLSFFRALATGTDPTKDDTVYEEMVRKKLTKELPQLPSDQIQEIIVQVKQHPEGRIAEWWFSLPYSSRHPELVTQLLKRDQQSTDKWIAKHILSQPHWKDHPEWVEHLLEKPGPNDALEEHVLSKSHWKNHPEWVEKLWRKSEYGATRRRMVQYVLSQSFWAETHPEWISELITDGLKRWDQHGFPVPGAYDDVPTFILSQPFVKAHPEWIDLALKNKSFYRGLASHVLTQPWWEDRSDFAEKLLDSGFAHGNGLYFSATRHHPEWVYKMITERRLMAFKSHLLPLYLRAQESAGRPEIIEELLNPFFPNHPKEQAAEDLILDEALRSVPHWRDDPTLRALCDGRPPTVAKLREAMANGKEFPKKWFQSIVVPMTPSPHHLLAVDSKGHLQELIDDQKRWVPVPESEIDTLGEEKRAHIRIVPENRVQVRRTGGMWVDLDITQPIENTNPKVYWKNQYQKVIRDDFGNVIIQVGEKNGKTYGFDYHSPMKVGLPIRDMAWKVPPQLKEIFSLPDTRSFLALTEDGRVIRIYKNEHFQWEDLHLGQFDRVLSVGNKIYLHSPEKGLLEALPGSEGWEKGALKTVPIPTPPDGAAGYFTVFDSPKTIRAAIGARGMDFKNCVLHSLEQKIDLQPK